MSRMDDLKRDFKRVGDAMEAMARGDREAAASMLGGQRRGALATLDLSANDGDDEKDIFDGLRAAQRDLDHEMAIESNLQVASVYLVAAKERAGEVDPAAPRALLLESTADALRRSTIGQELASSAEDQTAVGALRALATQMGVASEGSVSDVAAAMVSRVDDLVALERAAADDGKPQ